MAKKRISELEGPGNCTTCGNFAQYRNTAGQCTNCHNESCRQYRIERKKWLEEQKERGRQYWEKRGIKPGDKVITFVPSMLGFGGIRVVGIAKVGAVGAYVSAPHVQKGYLSPDGWQKLNAGS